MRSPYRRGLINGWTSARIPDPVSPIFRTDVRTHNEALKAGWRLRRKPLSSQVMMPAVRRAVGEQQESAIRAHRASVLVSIRLRSRHDQRPLWFETLPIGRSAQDVTA